VIAADAGQIIDPDGLENQLEGGFVQAASWTLKEQVAFDGDGIVSLDWESYPILRFDEVPLVETVLIDRPRERSLGAGEATTGPTPAAIANAIFDATGARVRHTPFTPARLRAALYG
jgi:CO/xanthine dehydrogenase Mo-binding subunit